MILGVFVVIILKLIVDDEGIIDRLIVGAVVLFIAGPIKNIVGSCNTSVASIPVYIVHNDILIGGVDGICIGKISRYCVACALELLLRITALLPTAPVVYIGVHPGAPTTVHCPVTSSIEF